MACAVGLTLLSVCSLMCVHLSQVIILGLLSKLLNLSSSKQYHMIAWLL